MAQTHLLSGEEWQRWANKLLTQHFGHTEYQTVPDNDRGDAGIEGFTISSGCAYQAYGCEEPLTTGDRYEAQRNKMTTDISKCINNQKILARIFGGTKIKRWILFVPKFDSKSIIEHASKKTAEVVAANLPYVDADFRVMVCQEDDFVVARDQLLSANTGTIDITPDTATPEQLSEWASANDGLVAKLQGKISRLPTISTESKRKAFLDQVLKWHLEGQSVLDELRRYPTVFEKVIRAKAHHENALAMLGASEIVPQKILSTALNDLKLSIKAEVNSLHSFSADTLAQEAVADWLLRCPLDFPGGSDG